MFFRVLRKRIIWVIGMILLLTIAVFSYGYIKKIPNIYDRIHPNVSLAEETSDPHIGRNTDKEIAHMLSVETNITILESTMKLERFYLSCGHTLDEEHPIESCYIGKTEEELHTLFPKWQVKRFVPEQVVLRMEISGYCPDHYIIREEDGYLIIFRADKDTGIPLVVEALEISLDQLSTELQKQIREGIVVDNMEAVEQLLENWES